MKRTLLASLAIFVAWTIVDIPLHRVILRDTYESTTILWRPENQMNIPLIYLVILALIVSFVMIYRFLIETKSLASGIRFGMLYGFATGISVGFGTYIHMPVPLTLAWGWFIGGLVKGIAAGAIVGAIIKPGTRTGKEPNQAL